VPTETMNAPSGTAVVEARAVTPQQPSPQPAATPPAGAAKAAPRAKRKFGIALYHAWCKRCGICGEFCPTKALRNDELGAPLVMDEDKCVGCMQCMHRCPDFCVEVYEKTAPPAHTAGPQQQAEAGPSGSETWG